MGAVLERFARESRAVPVLLIFASVCLPAAGVHFFAGEARAPVGYVTHFVVILTAAAISGAAAFALTAVGAARGEGRIVVVGTAFSAMAGLLGVHGLATEDVLVGEHDGLMALAGGAALPVAGAVISLSALPTLRRPGNVRWLVRLNAAILTGIVALGVFGLMAPAAVPEVPRAGSPAAVATLILGAAFFGILAIRATRTYALAHRRADFAVALGVMALGSALGLQLLFELWSWGWWIGHALEFAGIALVGVPVAFDIHRAGQSRPLIGDLRGADLVAQEEAYLGTQVRALLVRLAEKDGYTEGHTRRVARWAVEVGDALGLPPTTLRELAIGGLLHDIGKLSVPDEILKKPGALTDDEYAVIKRHPESGERLIGELGGFSAQVRRLVLHHHERLDGRGYPGAVGDEIDFPTRVLTACDVYDALVSNRVYRKAWSTEHALDLLREQSGAAFDPRCVAALEQVIARDRGTQGPAVEHESEAFGRRPPVAAGTGPMRAGGAPA
jgi:HD-GYP domain-containing protein (c-di-GMP phosphodiesterase class II)